jgi:hypothetical protein
VADHDPSTPAKVDPPRVPGLLDQYRQQRRALLAQADELVRMREEVRQAAEREAIDIVTAARRDVRRIIVEARRELLVLTAQLHAAVEAPDAPGIEAPPLTPLLADPEARTRVESASHDNDITRNLHEARKGVRSVLDEARAEIEALSSEAPEIFGQNAASDPADPHAADPSDDAAAVSRLYDEPLDQEPGDEAPVHELSLDASLAVLDFQTRDLPIPTLARLLGSEPVDDTPSRLGETPASHALDSPLLSYETPRLSELRSLLRGSIDAVSPGEPPDAPPPPSGRSVLSPDVEPPASSPFAFDTTPRPDFFADRDSPAPNAADESSSTADEPASGDQTPEFTPPSRLFGEDDSRSPARSARTFVGLFAATGALAVAGTIWWAVNRDSAPLSAAAPPVITEKSGAAPAASGTPAVAAPAPGTLALTIEARRPSWIRAQIDGKDETGRLYQAGETRHIYGARSVSIRAGDAGAVFVGVDGGTARALGDNGAAATKQFAAAVVPAAAPSGKAPVSLASATGATPAVATSRAPSVEPTVATSRTQVPVPAAQPPAPAARPATAAPAATDTAAAVRDGVAGGRPDLVQAAQQWLDAYQRRDRDAMGAIATDNVTVSDERSVTERFPAWQGGVQRDLDEVALELTGDVAVFTARMTEHADAAGGQHISRVSQFWQRRSGRWYVTNVRIIGEARLNQIIR